MTRYESQATPGLAGGRAWRAPLLALLLTCLAGCEREPLQSVPPPPDLGAATLALHVAAPADRIGFALTGPNGVTRTDDLPATGGAATTTVDSLPVADGYLVTATATSTDGSRCAGTSASFAVVLNQTVQIAVSLSCAPPDGPAEDPIEKIGHIVVIYMENHSFDNLYGGFPGVEGLSSPAANVPQIDDATGLPYQTLPQADKHLPGDLPNRPFDISQYIPPDENTIDLVHRFYQEQMQINGGKMDRFVTVSDAKGLVLGTYPTATLPVAELALANPTETTICDHLFHAAFGGSFLNHQWFIAAASPVFPNAPTDMVASVDDAGQLVRDGDVSPGGFVISGLEPSATPHGAGASPERSVPPQLAPTIGDRLSAAGVDWAWYSGGWDDAVAGSPDPLFIFTHQPFVYFAAYAEGTAARAAHLKDDNLLAGEIATGTLPPVAFVKPLGTEDEHPAQSDLISGQTYAVALIDSLMKSSFWNDTVVILTYDENGGYWDHVPPPVVDPWGPGVRVPTLVFSPFARGGVDSTVYDSTAVLKLIERRWNLLPLSARDAAQADLSAQALRLGP